MGSSAKLPKALSGQKWRTLRRIKLFCPHQLTFKNGSSVKVDDEEIYRIRDEMRNAEQGNQLATASVDHMILVGADGKVTSKKSEDINLLGFMGNHDVIKARDEKTGKMVPWLVADVFADPDKETTIRAMPYVSVEYWPGSHRISNVAFTKHKPQLDVGVILPYHWERGEVEHSEQASGQIAAYSVEGNSSAVVIYSSERSTMPADNNDLILDAINSINSLRKDFDTFKASGVVAPVVTPAVAAVPVPTVTAPVLTYAAVSGGGAVASEAEVKLRKLERTMKIETLGKTKKLNVQEEIALWGEKPEDVFNLHCDSIAACYASIHASGAKVTPLDAPGGSTIDRTLVHNIQRARVQAGKDPINYQAVEDRLKLNPTWDGMD